jgi:hypothetical protein
LTTGSKRRFGWNVDGKADPLRMAVAHQGRFAPR